MERIQFRSKSEFPFTSPVHEHECPFTVILIGFIHNTRWSCFCFNHFTPGILSFDLIWILFLWFFFRSEFQSSKFREFFSQCSFTESGFMVKFTIWKKIKKQYLLYTPFVAQLLRNPKNTPLFIWSKILFDFQGIGNLSTEQHFVSSEMKIKYYFRKCFISKWLPIQWDH